MSIVPLHSSRMSEAEYDAERAKLRAAYGDTAGEANGRREQELAALFYRSGWTQEELAEKEGMSRQWVLQRVLFGRFLDFATVVANVETTPKNLTERKFRSYWERTDKSFNERGRFVEVLKLIKEDVAVRADNRPKIGQIIVDQFADGKWHKEKTIAQAADSTEEHVFSTLHNMKKLGSYNCSAEWKTVGTHREYRLFKQGKMLNSIELIAKLTPIIEGLEVQGRKHVATFSVLTVATLARELRNLLDEWAE